MEPVSEIGKAIDEYGVAAILAALLMFLWWSVRVIYKLLLDPQSGLMIVTHREMMSSISSNTEANKINADANAKHSVAHERCSKALTTIAKKWPEVLNDEG